MIEWEIEDETQRRRDSGCEEISELAWEASARRVIELFENDDEALHKIVIRVGDVLAWVYPGDRTAHDEYTLSDVLDDLDADLSESGGFWTGTE